MAEALAVIGLASSLVQFVDFGSKVMRQLRRLEVDAAGMPAVFRDVRTRLPLMLDFVRNLMLQMDADLVAAPSQEVLLPVMRNCVVQAERLETLIAKALPDRRSDTGRSSFWSRGKKAVRGVMLEPEVEKMDAALKANFDLLAQAGTFHFARKKAEEEKSARESSLASASPPPPVFDMSGATVTLTLLPSKTSDRGSGEFLSPLVQQISADSGTIVPASFGQSVFMVPFPRDPNFLGRVEILDDIDGRFEKGQSSVAIAGLPGIGKTQIAIEYGYMFKDRYPDAHVFWVYGSDPARFEKSYQDIARKLALPGWDEPRTDVLQLVHEGLNSLDSRKWLFIMDNADDAEVFYAGKPGGRAEAKAHARYLPHGGDNASILITTRDRRVGDRLSGRQKPIDVTPMSAAECMELLHSRIAAEDWCAADAARLAAELSYLPLAVTQAAAFICENALTVAEYLATLSAGEADARELLDGHLEDPRRDLDSENSVMRTFKLSLDQLSRNVPRATELLALMAVLQYHAVQLTLLRRARESETAFRTALGALQAFSLVTASRGRDAICKTHPSVALATRKWLESRGTLNHWQGAAITVLCHSFPPWPEQSPQDWPVYEALVPHITLAVSYPCKERTARLDCAELLVNLSLYYLHKGRYAEADDMCSQALAIRRALLGDDDILIVEVTQTLGEALLHRMELARARDVLGKAVAGRERILGVEHRDTLESYSDLTITRLELDDLTRAAQTSARALDGRRALLGADDLETRTSLGIDAILQHRLGKLDLAQSQYEEVLARREELVGVEHPDTLMTLNNLARLYFDRADVALAKPALIRALAGEAKVLGAEGYDIQVTMGNMALVLMAEGEFDEAEAMLKRLGNIRTKILGADHPSTLFATEMMAGLHRRRGDEEAARKAEMDIDKSCKSGNAKKAARCYGQACCLTEQVFPNLRDLGLRADAAALFITKHGVGWGVKWSK